MNWIWNRCRRRRPEICLLAGGALGEEEEIELENHLAVCQECRSYYAEIKTLTAPLAGWEKHLSAIEATPAARMRWARAVQEAALPSSAPNPNLNLNPNPQRLRLRLGLGLGMRLWRIVWRELIRPSRHAWAGMAALWVVMLAVNGRLSDHRMIDAGASSAQDMMQAWEEQNRVLAELTQPAFAVPAAPPILPRPRSEREQDWKIV
jgi:hypothetical protein